MPVDFGGYTFDNAASNTQLPVYGYVTFRVTRAHLAQWKGQNRFNHLFPCPAARD